MTSGDLPDGDNAVRYVRPTYVLEDGAADGKAFQLRPNRPDETGLSVNWLDYYVDIAEDERLDEVRRVFRLTLSSSGRFAELNVGAAKRAVRRELDALRFIHNPLPPDEEHAADPSHSLIIGLPPASGPKSALIGEMIAMSVGRMHPART